MGTLHYEKTSAKRMIKVFATHIEYDLVEYILDSDLPFSIIMDGSTSNRGTKWMTYLLRTLTPNNTPFTFHLLFAELRQETAAAIVETFFDHLKDISTWQELPGLTANPFQYTMQRLVALATDGASVMKGEQSGVYALIQNRIQTETASTMIPRKRLLLSICDAHTLNNAMKDIKHPAYLLAKFLIMKMHALFESVQGLTARRIYKKTSKLMGFPYLHMGAFYEVRWSDSLGTLFAKRDKNLSRSHM